MPVKGEVPWACAPHTAAKHDIYRRYLERWFPILLAGSNAYPSVTYAEGFAGPGVYSGGEPGSPVVAMKALVQEVPADKGIARFVFIDDDQRCVELLPRMLTSAFPERPRSQTAMPVQVVRGTCADKLEGTLDSMSAWGQPIFANLDSWGNAPVPYAFLERLAANEATEVMITLLPQHFVRFVTDLGAAGDEVFGGDASWRTMVDLDSGAKSRHILTCYRKALQAAGFSYLLDFELMPRNGQPLYLIFGTTHPLGVQKMKDSLWEVDRSSGVGFRDPRDEQAETLFDLDEPLLTPLTRLLGHRLQDGEPARVESLRQYALFETIYRPEHVISALKPLVDESIIHVDHSGPLRRASFVRLARTTAPK